MKAILVVEMPTTCTDCPCYDYIHGVCANTHKDCELRIQEKPTWCPLKDLPQKMTMEKALKMERCGSIKDIYTTWDACLAEITGETE